jgi:hypothetical protein
MGRKTSTYTRKRAHKPAPKNRLIAIAEREASNAVRRASDAAFQSQITTVKIKMLMAEDGEDATELLSILAVVIGTPAQAGCMAGMHDQPWVRQLHGAMRSVQDMCLHGYQWQTRYALALTRACEIAGEDQPCFSVDVFYRAWLDANSMSELISAHRVDQFTVVA